ncbi:MAG: thioredoxin family protein [Fimbriimonadaceae bacterium]|nr:thioredoxin family protein [Fimbriimonadaceae bacterium]
MTQAPFLARFPIPIALVAWLALGAVAQNVPPTVTVKLDKPTVSAGKAFQGTATVTFGPGLHGYQNPPSQDYMIPVSLTLANKEFKLAKVAYPKGVVKSVAGDQAAVYDGTIAIAFQGTAPTKVGKFKLKFELGYQQCTDENCFPPGSVTAEVPFTVVKAGSEPDPEPEPAATVATEKPSASPPTEGLAGSFQRFFSEGNYFLLFGVLFLVGLAVNLTPCVYPMIPITLGFFSNQAAGSRATRVQLGLMYMLGIGVMYGLVGGIVSGLGLGFGTLFTQTWFNVALGLLMIVLALSMFGLYEIGIPAPLQRHLHGRSGIVGAFIMGMLVGVGAAPCAGPAIAAIAAKAAEQRNVVLGTAMFTTVGLGLGLPYLVLAGTAAGAKALPRAGGWMTVVKSILGLIVIGVGLNYLLQAFAANGQVVTLVWTGFGLASALYLFLFDKTDLTKVVLRIKGAAILGFGLFGGMAFQQYQQVVKDAELARLGAVTRTNWIPFDDASFEAAKASGKPIFIDATANWCAECRHIEHTIFDTPRGIVALGKAVTMKIDWSTGADQAYVKKTADLFDISGLPHLVVLKPGGEIHAVKNQLKSVDELEAVLREAGAE